MLKALTTSALLLTITVTIAAADTSLAIALEMERGDSITSTAYSCADGQDLEVQYIISGTNALALMEIEDEDRVFVSVVSGSGARFVSGSYVWSTKGASGTLENTLGDNDAIRCEAEE